MNKEIAIEKYYQTEANEARRKGEFALADELEKAATEMREERKQREFQERWDNDTIDLY
jgi:hypothetical protein